MNKILLPVDGSDMCTKSYKYAKDFAMKYDAEILIVNVQSLPYQWAYAHSDLEYDRKKYNELGNDIVNKAKLLFDESKVRTMTKVEFGDPASTIIDVAKKENCDIIIMCTHGMGAVKRFTIGSVTNKVVHHADIPVLVVR
ncbi:universal stress protein [Dethiothermospora halolimnae]|uniref:universal stress protein n=1 Tax=Dethiothermospora halolimnae TaxID=3114390 RepID=UPI003CCB85DD